VNPEVLSYAKSEAVIYNSAELNLDEIADIMEKSVQEGGLVARVHTGDPAIYGAIAEQIQHLKEKHIDYEITPLIFYFSFLREIPFHYKRNYLSLFKGKNHSIENIENNIICLFWREFSSFI